MFYYSSKFIYVHDFTIIFLKKYCNMVIFSFIIFIIEFNSNFFLPLFLIRENQTFRARHSAKYFW